MEFIIVALIALIIGSFLNVVIYRLPLGQSIILPASHCRLCKVPLRFWHNIPIISFVAQKGHCHACKQAISWRYPVVELLSLILSLIVFSQVGWHILLLPTLLFTYALLALTFIDIDEQILPDCITLPLLWAGLFFNSFDLLVLAPSAIWGALLGFTLLWLIDRLYTMVRKHPGIGMGDCKLLAAIGAWLGLPALIPVLLIASVLGLAVAVILIISKRLKYNSPLAFGPFLAIAAWAYLFKVV